ncbi:MAG: transglutaminase [Pseudomonadota bacterium]
MASDMFYFGAHRGALQGLPADPAALALWVQGLLLHDVTAGLLYPDEAARLAAASRATLPVSVRLDRLLTLHRGDLCAPRAPRQRDIGTCRDFALLFCAALRLKGFDAQVRCGFARYFHPPGFEDHWICLYRPHETARWRIADPQLDAAHLAHYEIKMDPRDIPADQFLFAADAWRAVRDGTQDAAHFGHGDARGLWFMAVNVMRDALAQEDRITSDWDAWRAADPARLTLAAARQTDRVADGPAAPPAPFWHPPLGADGAMP